jgi:competence protein ComEC
MGDIEATGEERLLVSGQQLESDVVKVAHHGSRTSSSEGFVEAIAPLYAIVPVGIRSPYGHPHKEVVDRWIQNGAGVIKVGENGTTNVSTNGSDIKVETFAGQPTIQKPDRFP